MNSRFFIFLGIILFSLTTHAQVQFSLFGGGQATSARYLVKDIKQPTQFKYGTMGGLAVKVEFDNQLYFFPAIFYSLKGYKVTLNNSAFPPTELAKNNDLWVHTIEVAPLFHFDFNKKAAHLFVRFGPSVDYGYYGNEIFDTVSGPGTGGRVYRRMRFDFTEYGRFTAQANLHFGYETGKGLMAFAFYQRGFGSMNNHDGGPKIFHRTLGVSVGWLFGRNPLVKETKPI
ncbi:MAG TPA: outer membrane beta-barrel protein [Flavisolibacter sp.]|nr:outer membrane beta-barrel protein [Flavisolibacter sp.]